MTRLEVDELGDPGAYLTAAGLRALFALADTDRGRLRASQKTDLAAGTVSALAVRNLVRHGLAVFASHAGWHASVTDAGRTLAARIRGLPAVENGLPAVEDGLPDVEDHPDSYSEFD